MKKSKKATEQALGELHELLAQKLKELVTKKYVDGDGNEIPCPPAVLNVARQFLKDNKIECDMDAYKGNDKFLQPDDLPYGESEDADGDDTHLRH